MKKMILTILLMALLAGCSGYGRRYEEERPFEYPVPITPTETAQNATVRNDGSLFDANASGWSPWTDVTARRVGDIVTVRVAVDTSAENSATTDLSRAADIDAGITAMLGREESLPGIGMGNTTKEQLVKSSSSSEFQGDGDTRRSGSIVADVSAVVTHVYQNGNMRVHGSQTTLVNNENSLITIEGIIRPADVSAENIIYSERIANASIQVTGKGVVSDKQRPGILMRAFDWFFPF